MNSGLGLDSAFPRAMVLLSRGIVASVWGAVSDNESNCWNGFSVHQKGNQPGPPLRGILALFV